MRELRRLERMAPDIDRSLTAVHRNIAKLVKRTAFTMAPKSPTQAVINRFRKTRRKVKRKPGSTVRPKPGGLERSITIEADSRRAEIFIPVNSEAGRYAYRIHEERFISWRNLGPGSIAKGAQVGEKFIERAVQQHDDNGDISRIIAFETDRAAGA